MTAFTVALAGDACTGTDIARVFRDSECGVSVQLDAGRALNLIRQSGLFEALFDALGIGGVGE